MSHVDRKMQSWGKSEEYANSNHVKGVKRSIDESTTLVEPNEKNLLVKLKKKLKKRKNN